MSKTNKILIIDESDLFWKKVVKKEFHIRYNFDEHPINQFCTISIWKEIHYITNNTK